MDDVMSASEQEIDQHLAEAIALEKEKGKETEMVPQEQQNGTNEQPAIGQAQQEDASAAAADAALDCYEALAYPPDMEMNDTRIAVIGNVDSGKSTVIGVLTSGSLDNGRGQARAYVMKHRHELENGRTSAVTVEIMGFTASEGENPPQQVIPTARHHDQRWHEVMEKSDSTVSLIDLCGHEKYLKTTLFGLTGLMPDYAMLVVGKCLLSILFFQFISHVFPQTILCFA
jgi:ATPase subunit of ABC transporter with duplicated ATPase domains